MNKVYDGFKIVKARLMRNYFPYYVDLILNNSCNLRCSYCYKRFYDRATEEISTEDIFKIIDDLAKLGTRRLCILGGEPLMRENLAEIIDRIKKNRIVCGISTNGILVKKNIELIKKLDHIHISLDGDREANDLNRGAGTYDKIIEAIELISRDTKTPIGIACVLTKKNIDSMERLVEIAKGYKADVTFYILMNQQDEEGNMNVSKLMPVWDENMRAIDKMILLKKKGEPIRYSYGVYNLTKRWPLKCQDTVIGREPDFKWIDCFAGKFFCTMDADGKVYPCPRVIGEVKALNAVEIGFEQAYNYIRDNNPCKACNILCYNELNSIFGLQISALFNQLSRRF